MGTLKPGATLIYERNNGIVYAREIGSDPSTRVEIGRNYDSRTPDGRPLHDYLKEKQLWTDITLAAQTNPALQEALDRVRVIYELSKEND
jgi:hypothetical protein